MWRDKRCWMGSRAKDGFPFEAGHNYGTNDPCMWTGGDGVGESEGSVGELIHRDDCDEQCGFG